MTNFLQGSLDVLGVSCSNKTKELGNPETRKGSGELWCDLLRLKYWLVRAVQARTQALTGRPAEGGAVIQQVVNLKNLSK